MKLNKLLYTSLLVVIMLHQKNFAHWTFIKSPICGLYKTMQKQTYQKMIVLTTALWLPKV
jgi:hypothetical protein